MTQTDRREKLDASKEMFRDPGESLNVLTLPSTDDLGGAWLDSENTVELEQSQGERLVPEVTGRCSHGLADILKAFLLQG